LFAACFPPEPSAAKSAPSPQAVTDDDAALLALARSAKNGAKFAALYEYGDTSAYNGDRSSADMALCCELAFWTQRDAARMDRLFRGSALYRPKWDERRGNTTYGAMTIQRAIDQTREVYELSAMPHPNGHAKGMTAEGKRDRNGDGDRRKESKASALIKLARDEIAELWYTPDDAAYATIIVNGVRQHWPLRSRAFAQWLARRFYEQTATNEKTGQSASRDDLAAAVMTLEGIARFNGAEHAVFVRVAEHHGRVYLDLCDLAWRAVEIDADGWRIVDDPPVRFTRARGMFPLPEPQPGGSLDGLRRLLNVESSDDDWRLLVGWLVGALRPRGPYPVLVLLGEQGTAKSTTARLLRGLVDPSAVPLRAAPREVRDLMIAATHSWCVAFDNISHVQGWLSDALCRLSTGGGFGTRELYTDTDEVLLDAMRPVVLTAITEVVEQGDLLDRALLVRLPAIPEEKRRPESELLVEYERIRPQALGALCDAVASALRHEADVRRSLRRLPRLADWAIWAVAATRALGWQDDDLLAAFRGRRKEVNDLALEASPLGALLVQIAHADGGWQGTADELRRACALLAARAELPEGAPERAEQVVHRAEYLLTKDKAWPHNPRAMRALLDRLAPHLRAEGVSVEYLPRKGHERSRLIRIRTVGAQSSAPSAPSAAYSPHVKCADSPADDLPGAAAGSSAQSSARQPLPDRVADDADDADGPIPTVRGEAGDEKVLSGLSTGIKEIAAAATAPPPPKCWRCGRPLPPGRTECFTCSVWAYEIRSLPVPEWLQRLAAQERK
jgi:hypothetical protein